MTLLALHHFFATSFPLVALSTVLPFVVLMSILVMVAISFEFFALDVVPA
jgi:hypothetical protein